MRLLLGITAFFVWTFISSGPSSVCGPNSVCGQSFRPVRSPANSGSPVVSENFIVQAEDPILARKVSSEAERFRKELAQQWLGRELEPWSHKCPINVQVGMHAGGETSFAFMTDRSGRGKPVDWKMKIYGPVDRLLDAVLPHEITHTIFASHFGRPLPRWADEGACTTVEHESERNKNHRMLLDFLSAQPSRGIPFNQMFAMRNYPHDILPLYAQGYSLAKFLILQQGRRHFLNYIGKGLENEQQHPELKAWSLATEEFYNYSDLSELQTSWLGWVREGSQENKLAQFAKTQPAIAQSTPPPNSQAAPMTFARAEPQTPRNASTNALPGGLAQANQANQANQVNQGNQGSWYERQMKPGDRTRIAAKRQDLPTQTRKVAPHSEPEIRDTSLPAEFRGGATIWR